VPASHSPQTGPHPTIQPTPHYAEALGEDPTPRWTVAFRVADADQTAAEAERLGGKVVLPPMDVPVGRFANIADPGGAEFTAAAVPAGAFRGVDGS
jgi:Glyoxalase-like domain